MCAKFHSTPKMYVTKKQLGFSSMHQNIKRKNEREFHFLKRMCLLMKTLFIISFFGKIKRGDLCKRDLPVNTLEWVDFFEKPNLEGIIVGHIQICRGEISGM